MLHRHRLTTERAAKMLPPFSELNLVNTESCNTEQTRGEDTLVASHKTQRQFWYAKKGQSEELNENTYHCIQLCVRYFDRSGCRGPLRSFQPYSRYDQLRSELNSEVLLLLREKLLERTYPGSTKMHGSLVQWRTGTIIWLPSGFAEHRCLPSSSLKLVAPTVKRYPSPLSMKSPDTRIASVCEIVGSAEPSPLGGTRISSKVLAAKTPEP